MTSKAISSTIRKISISDETEYHWTVQMDRDTDSVVELIYWEDGKENAHMTFVPDAARLIAKAILDCSNEVEAIS